MQPTLRMDQAVHIINLWAVKKIIRENKTKQKTGKKFTTFHGIFKWKETSHTSYSLRIVSSDMLFTEGFSIAYLLEWKMS